MAMMATGALLMSLALVLVTGVLAIGIICGLSMLLGAWIATRLG